MKLLYLTQWDADGTFYYRMLPLSYIDHPRIKIERKPYHGEIGYSLFAGYTHLFLERPSGSHDLHVMKLAKQMGLKIIIDADDDCLHLDSYNPMYHVYENAKKTVLECISEADEVWVSTEGIKRSYALLNKNIHVIANSHNDYLFPVKDKRPFNMNTKKAVWRGGQSHESDVYDKAEEIVKVVNGNMDWMFYFVGCRFIWLEQRCGDNYQPVSQMPLMQYFNFIYDQNPNVIFHPLCDTIFNKSKSNIAWVEASYAGAAFFGNNNLPEFAKYSIENIEYLNECLTDNRKDLFEAWNRKAWELIQDTLLLSNVNNQRVTNLLNL